MQQYKDFMELSLHRQSCRKFTDQTVEHEKLVRCVQAARLTPSACNSQPWTFVVVESQDKVKAIGESFAALGHNTWATTAKAFIVILEEHAVLMPQVRRILDSQYWAKGDLGAAALQICLAAEDQGLGSCTLGLFDREKLCEILDLPITQRFAYVIPIGYPADPAVRQKARKPLDDIVRYV